MGPQVQPRDLLWKDTETPKLKHILPCYRDVIAQFDPHKINWQADLPSGGLKTFDPHFTAWSDVLKLNRIGKFFCIIVAIGSIVGRLRAEAQTRPNLVLQGDVTHAQNQTYIQVPFQIPRSVFRLTVTFHYTGKDQGTRLDLGIFDPNGFRGASGGNKSSFTISGTDATPSYLPGPILAGRWYLLIAVPNIRPNVVAHYTADIFFETTPTIQSFSDGPLRKGPAWYRGDLHMHTGHSDGTCPSQAGKSVPCPVFVTADAAVRRGLDFIAITDHTTISQYGALRALQPYFDQLLLIPGREITTFQGHANVFGITRFVDYRIGTHNVPDMNAIARRVHQLGGIISINHPNAPSGEICLGCGWQPNPPADIPLFSAIEAVNGGSLQGPYSGVSFWKKQLNDGYRIPAIGGSDNHHGAWTVSHPDSVGIPTTVIYAQDLSVPAILNGIRAGHVFIDLTGSHNRMLEMTAAAPGLKPAMMGDTLRASAGSAVQITIHVVGCSGWTLKLSDNDRGNSALPSRVLSQQDATVQLSWPSDGKRHWLLSQVEKPDGELELLGNPIYVNYPEATGLPAHPPINK